MSVEGPKGREGPEPIRSDTDKAIEESSTAKQVPSSGKSLPVALKKFLNFLWRLSGSSWITGEATFSNWNEKKQLVQTLTKKTVESNSEVFEKNPEIKAIAQKRFETLYNGLSLDQLQKLSSLMESQPNTVYFLCHNEIHFKDTFQTIQKMFQRPAFTTKVMAMPELLRGIGLSRNEVFNFIAQTLQNQNEAYADQFSAFAADPFSHDPPVGFLETEIGKKVVCQHFPDQAEAFISRQAPENQPLLVAWLIEKKDAATAAFLLAEKFSEPEKADNFISAVYELSSENFGKLQAFMEDPASSPVPPFVFRSERLYLPLRSLILSKFDNPERLGRYLDRFSSVDQREILKNMLDNQEHTNSLFQFLGHLENLESNTENRFINAVRSNCSQEWLDLADEFARSPSPEMLNLLLSKANHSIDIEVVLRRFMEEPEPATLKETMERVKRGHFHRWPSGELALMSKKPPTDVAPFINLVRVDASTLEEVTKGIDSPPRTFEHQIALPNIKGGYQYSETMTVEKGEGEGYVFKLKAGGKTFEYTTPKKPDTPEELQMMILQARVAWVKEGI